MSRPLPNPENFNKIAHSVVFSLLSTVYDKLLPTVKSVNDVIHLDGETFFSRSLQSRDIALYDVFFHEIFYGPKDIITKKRISTKELWTSLWDHEKSPFEVAQELLSKYGFYLSDNSTLSDKKLKLTLFFVGSNRNLNKLWHSNNTFPSTNFKKERSWNSFQSDIADFRKVYNYWEDQMYLYSGAEVFRKIDNLLSFKTTLISKPDTNHIIQQVPSNSSSSNHIIHQVSFESCSSNHIEQQVSQKKLTIIIDSSNDVIIKTYPVVVRISRFTEMEESKQEVVLS